MPFSSRRKGVASADFVSSLAHKLSECRVQASRGRNLSKPDLGMDSLVLSVMYL